VGNLISEPHSFTQCYQPPNTSERTHLNPSQASWYLIYQPRRDGRLSWPRWLATYPPSDGHPSNY